MSWTRTEMAERVAALLPPGSYVNLGIGLPTAVAAAVPAERGVTFFCENGLVGYEGLPEGEEPDPDVIDAGSKPVKLSVGAAIVPHEIAFTIARGQHLDCAVLGAHQVSATGDLANWAVPGQTLAGVGGAMDLAVGARRVVAMMRHRERDGRAKLVSECTYPLTAARCVDTVVTDLAVIDVTAEGLTVRETAPGVTWDQLRASTDAPLLAPSPVS